MYRRANIILYALLLFCAVLGGYSHAEELKSEQYIITDPVLDLANPVEREVREETMNLLKTKQEKTRFTEAGYIVRTYSEPIEASIQNASVTLDRIADVKTLEQSVQITVTHRKGRSAGVTLGQLTALQSLSGSVIDATRCDDVYIPCTRTEPKEWESDTATGVGYSTRNGLFAPFPRIYSQENDVLVITKGRDEDATEKELLIRVRKSPEDRTESYQTIIRLTTGLLF